MKHISIMFSPESENGTKTKQKIPTAFLNASHFRFHRFMQMILQCLLDTIAHGLRWHHME